MKRKWASWCWADRMAALLFACAILLRLWSAWCSRCITDVDSSVVALMATHMAEGKAWPIFFYGQAYMGSLEPLVSAFFVFGLGATGFAVNLGPALVSWIALFFLWRWARDAAGPWGGVAALSICIVGPAAYFYFQTAPRGGYMVALCINAWVLWLAARWTADWGERPASVFAFLGLGLLAGLGLWSNMMVAAALLTAAVILAWAMKLHVWKHLSRIVAGLCGLALGLWPVVLYHLNHVSITWATGMDRMPLSLRATVSTLWKHWVALQEPIRTPSMLAILLALLWLVLAVWGGLALGCTWTTRFRRERSAGMAAILFCTVFAIFHACSGFVYINTPRYWIPWVPGLAVLCGMACRYSSRKMLRLIPFVLVGVGVILQCWIAFPSVAETGRQTPSAAAHFEQIADALQQHDVPVAYAPLRLYPLNFFAGETICIDDGQKIFDPTIARALEQSENPGFFTDYAGIETFLRQSDADFQVFPAGRRGVVHDIVRTQAALRRVPNDLHPRITDSNGQEIRNELLSPSDETVEWIWQIDEPQPLHTLYIYFVNTAPLHRIQMPDNIDVEGRSEAGEWQSLLDGIKITPLEWSGPRVYPARRNLKLLLPLGNGTWDALRIRLHTPRWEEPKIPWHAAEVNVLQADDTLPPPSYNEESVHRLVQAIEKIPLPDQERAAVHIYADRWLANTLLRLGIFPERQLAGLNPKLFPESPAIFPSDAPLSSIYILERWEADGVRTCLRQASIVFSEQAVRETAWILFHVPAPPSGLRQWIWACDTLLPVDTGN